jgi:hypothetical protein
VFDEESQFLESSTNATAADPRTFERTGTMHDLGLAAFMAGSAHFDGDSDASEEEDGTNATKPKNDAIQVDGDGDAAPLAKRQRLSSATEVKVVDFSCVNRLIFRQSMMPQNKAIAHIAPSFATCTATPYSSTPYDPPSLGKVRLTRRSRPSNTRRRTVSCLAWTTNRMTS